MLEVPRSGANYESKKAIADAPVVGKMRELAAQYPRYGYRMIRGLLATKGIAMSADRAHRLWRGAGLQVPRRRPRRRVAANRPRPVPPSAPNHVWAIDFVHDTCADGRPLKCLTVIDAWTHECLAIDVGTELRKSDKVSVADLTKKHDVSAETIYGWKRKFGGMNVDEAKRLKMLEAENAKLKKLLAERLLDIEVLKDINSKKW